MTIILMCVVRTSVVHPEHRGLLSLSLSRSLSPSLSLSLSLSTPLPGMNRILVRAGPRAPHIRILLYHDVGYSDTLIT